MRSEKSGSTTDIRKMSGAPPIVVFVLSRALFYDLLLFVFDLFGFDGSLLVLVREKTG